MIAVLIYSIRIVFEEKVPTIERAFDECTTCQCYSLYKFYFKNLIIEFLATATTDTHVVVVVVVFVAGVDDVVE